MPSSHEKGIIGELTFTAHLLELGYSVLNPINPNSSYDIVLEKDGVFTRVQVKYCTPKNGRIRVELRRPKKEIKEYKYRGVDAMGVFDSTNKKFYLIPITEIKKKDEIWLRIAKPKNYQIKNINNAVEFEI